MFDELVFRMKPPRCADGVERGKGECGEKMMRGMWRRLKVNKERTARTRSAPRSHEGEGGRLAHRVASKSFLPWGTCTK